MDATWDFLLVSWVQMASFEPAKKMRSTYVTSLILFAFILPVAHAQNVPASNGYLINAGDTLDVSVWREEALQREVLVRPDGGFSFPLAGDLRAQGRTVVEIQEDLRERLSRYIPDLVITVTVIDVGGNQIYVIGQVNQPGGFVMNPQLDVLQALSLAGGTTPFASLKDIRILRRQGQEQVALPFDYVKVSQGAALDQNIVLRSGDVVVVP